MGNTIGYDPLETVLQLKITLKGIRPPIWRRVLVPAYATLYNLHRVIQNAMGWEDAHLYEFDIQGLRYGEPDPGWMPFFGPPIRQAGRYRLFQVAGAEKSKFLYTYDFGDTWVHQITVEKVLPLDPEMDYPVCIKGKRACPPEDCGGIEGYYRVLEAISPPPEDDGTGDHIYAMDPEVRAELLAWLGGHYDPEAFDLHATNMALATVPIRRPKSLQRG